MCCQVFQISWKIHLSAKAELIFDELLQLETHGLNTREHFTSCAHLMLNYNEGFANCHKQLIIFCYIIFSHMLIILLCLYSIVSSLSSVYYTNVVYYMKSCQSKVRKNMHIQISVKCSRFEQPYCKQYTEGISKSFHLYLQVKWTSHINQLNWEINIWSL